MAAKKSSNTATKELQYEKMYRKLRRETKGFLPVSFAAEAERCLTGSGNYAVVRRFALALLEKPFTSWVENVKSDRDFAISMAKLSDEMGAVVKAYKDLADWMSAAEVRMIFALATRRDMEDILKAAKEVTPREAANA